MNGSQFLPFFKLPFFQLCARMSLQGFILALIDAFFVVALCDKPVFVRKPDLALKVGLRPCKLLRYL